MAREFSTSEIIRQKCYICGMNNKKYTELIYNKSKCGYKLTCCNCSHVDTFITDIEHIADHLYTKGKEICIHHTTCKNRLCPYYGEYPLWTAAMKIDDILNGLDDKSCTCNSIPCTCNKNNSQNSNIKKSDDTKLVINGYDIDKPKFH